MTVDAEQSGPKIGNDKTVVLEKIISSLKGIQYGSVEIVIHDGRIVQIERKEKVRLKG